VREGGRPRSSGLSSVRAEFAFLALTHNLLKLFRRGTMLAMA
jgi:hypothetical protein